jgi:nitrite reductase (NADH) large subunit
MKVHIIGNGVAGVTAARWIREHDPDCGIEIYAREPYHYYYRLRLPEVVAGEIDIDEIVANPPDWYDSHRIDVHLSTPVASVDAGERTFTLEDGSTVPYETLLIASGADPFIPPVDGVDRAGVFALRTADDAIAIRDRARRSQRAVIVGGGLLGLEAARGLVASGVEVQVLETAPRLLPRQLDDRGAHVLATEIERLGIKLHIGVKMSGVTGNGEATGVALDDGTEVPGELVLFSTGVRCTTDLLKGSGVDVNRGVVVDCGMRTNVPGVYAAGDVAEYEERVWGIIPVALAQADSAAKTITGDASEKVCEVTPHNTLKITGIDVFSAGTVTCEAEGCREYVEEDLANCLYRKILVRGGKPIGAIVIGSRNGVRQLAQMIEHGVDVRKWGDAIARDDFDYDGALKAAV